MTPLTALVTGLTFALVNAAHCAGMCGVFAMRATASSGWAGLFVYGTGKAFTYAFLGTLAAGFGAGVLGAGTEAQIILGLGVGAVLVAAGIVRMRPRAFAPGWGAGVTTFLQPMLATLGRSDSWGGRFTLGALTAALPCGVVYLGALQAAATGNAVSALVLMAGLALGTLPALGVVAFFGRGVLAKVPPHRLRLASGVLMILLGLVAVARAAMPLLHDGSAGSCCH